MKNIKLITIALFASSIFLTSCTKDEEIFGSDTFITDVRDVSDFNRIIVEGIADTYITYGEIFEVNVFANDNILEYINTKVNGDRLEITMESKSFRDIDIDINITCPNLKEVTKRGVGNTTVSGFNDLKELEVNHFGVASLFMEGKVENLYIEKSGVGSFNGFDLITNNCQIEQNGIGNTEIYCIDKLSGELSGIGNILYKGNPDINVEISGIGSLKDAN